jgi:hypothetical protein
MKHAFVRAALVTGGLFNVITALALLFAPEWFFETIGNYPPYNRHYLGDAGSFVLALGLILLWAVRDPARYRPMIALVGLGSLVHAMNHVVDDVTIANPTMVSVTSNGFLFVFAFVLLLAAWWADTAAIPKHKPSEQRS